MNFLGANGFTRTVFLDRDGTLNSRRDDYVKSWEEFVLLPGAVEAVVRLSKSGRDVIVITNQSAIAQGLVTADTVDDIHEHFANLVAAEGGRVRAFLVCPHGRDEGCNCRKPAPGLLIRAREELGVNLGESVVVGDQISDIQAALAAGCSAMLVEDDCDFKRHVGELPCVVVPSLSEAVDLICDRDVR